MRYKKQIMSFFIIIIIIIILILQDEIRFIHYN